VFFFPSPSSHFFIFQFVAFFVIFKLLNTIFAAIWHSKTDSEKMLSKLQDAHIYFSGVKLDLILFLAPHQHIPQSAHQDNLGEPRRARRAGAPLMRPHLPSRFGSSCSRFAIRSYPYSALCAL
jgi:hypothetical protein